MKIVLESKWDKSRIVQKLFGGAVKIIEMVANSERESVQYPDGSNYELLVEGKPFADEYENRLSSKKWRVTEKHRDGRVVILENTGFQGYKRQELLTEVGYWPKGRIAYRYQFYVDRYAFDSESKHTFQNGIRETFNKNGVCIEVKLLRNGRVVGEIKDMYGKTSIEIKAMWKEMESKLAEKEMQEHEAIEKELMPVAASLFNKTASFEGDHYEYDFSSVLQNGTIVEKALVRWIEESECGLFLFERMVEKYQGLPELDSYAEKIVSQMTRYYSAPCIDEGEKS